MQLTLNRHEKDPYPACGFFIEGDSLRAWIATLDRLGLDPTNLQLHGLPTREANVVWGCLVLTKTLPTIEQLGPLATAHLAAGRLVVPAKSIVVPELTDYDLERLFRNDTYVLHPDFGLVKLTEPLSLSDHFDPGEITELATRRPADYAPASGDILSFSIAASPAELIEEALNAGVEREDLKDKPLNLAEKLRLKLYRSVLGAANAGAGIGGGGAAGAAAGGKSSGGGDGRASKLQQLAAKLGLSGAEAIGKMLADLNDLEERNRREVDKLLDLMKKDPESALRYAIPLDEHGYSRGGTSANFKMQDRGSNFSLFGNRRGGSGGRSGGGSVNLGEEYFRLQQQYRAAAEELKRQGKYEKAAYIYLKLLNDARAAAETLKLGEHYEQAATVYLRYLKDKQAAAQCYVKGKIYEQAIPLYTELGKWEVVGNLNRLLNKEKAALAAYEKQVDLYLERYSYIKAAKLVQEKMYDLPRTQTILLKGWEEDRDAYNCLQYYLSNLPDDATAWRELQRISAHQLNVRNEPVFVKILAQEYGKQHEHQADIKELAYELISKLLPTKRVSAHVLLNFNEDDTQLRADAARYEVR